MKRADLTTGTVYYYNPGLGPDKAAVVLDTERLYTIQRWGGRIVPTRATRCSNDVGVLMVTGDVDTVRAVLDVPNLTDRLRASETADAARDLLHDAGISGAYVCADNIVKIMGEYDVALAAVTAARDAERAKQEQRQRDEQRREQRRQEAANTLEQRLTAVLGEPPAPRVNDVLDYTGTLTARVRVDVLAALLDRIDGDTTRAN